MSELISNNNDDNYVLYLQESKIFIANNTFFEKSLKKRTRELYENKYGHSSSIQYLNLVESLNLLLALSIFAIGYFLFESNYRIVLASATFSVLILITRFLTNIEFQELYKNESKPREILAENMSLVESKVFSKLNDLNVSVGTIIQIAQKWGVKKDIGMNVNQRTEWLNRVYEVYNLESNFPSSLLPLSMNSLNEILKTLEEKHTRQLEKVEELHRLGSQTLIDSFDETDEDKVTLAIEWCKKV